ncbi:MAG TPA: hypothetical protein VN771_06490 [Candidatus Baltobacteraceae bacterium]|nr:hypothetical protein [Candidatus Baltobacteraceae bacterium]
MLRRILIGGAGLVAATATITVVGTRRAARTWGIDPLETAKPLPGDDLIADPTPSDTRGLEIAAPPEAVWPWLVQMGYGRAGWYSYDAIDMDRPSAHELVPELQRLAVGDLMPTHPGGGFLVKELEPEQALVLYLDDELVKQQAAKPAKPASVNLKATSAALETMVPGQFRATWTFVLEPRDGGHTRLIERFRIATPMTGPIAEMLGGFMGLGVFVMVRRQMLGIQARVEGRWYPQRWFRPWRYRTTETTPVEPVITAPAPAPA